MPSPSPPTPPASTPLYALPDRQQQYLQRFGGLSDRVFGRDQSPEVQGARFAAGLPVTAPAAQPPSSTGLASAGLLNQAGPTIIPRDQLGPLAQALVAAIAHNQLQEKNSQPGNSLTPAQKFRLESLLKK